MEAKHNPRTSSGAVNTGTQNKSYTQSKVNSLGYNVKFNVNLLPVASIYQNILSNKELDHTKIRLCLVMFK